MAEHTRKDPRAKVLSMTVRYKSATLDEFIEHHSHDVSRGGMYIKTPQPFPPGTLLKFEVKIAADQKVMQGVGRVVWRREADDATADHPAGMGVKFIKLDDVSKDIIDQLVTARMGDISAFDEVAPEAEAAQEGQSESQAEPKASAEGFFPKSVDNVQQPAPEDRTVMKQATELLQEALREVSGGSGSDHPAIPVAPADAIPKAPKVAAVTPSPAKVARSAERAHEQTPRYQRIPTPVAAATKSESPSAKPAAVTSTPAAARSRSDRASARASEPAAQSFEPSAPSATSKPIVEPAPKTVPASPMAARPVAPAAPAADDDEYKLPIKKTIPPNRGMRIGVTLALVGGVAVAVFAFTRKSAPPPAPEPEPAPSVSQKIESAPAVLDVTGNAAVAAPSASASASAAPSEAPAASAAPSAEPAAPAVEEAPKPAPAAAAKPKVTTHKKKADAGTQAAPPLDTADELYPTPAPTPAPAEPKPAAAAPTATANTGATDSTAKSKPKPAPAPAPAPTTEESPL